MNEFDSFLRYLSEDLFEIERDKKRMLEFCIAAKKQAKKLVVDLKGLDSSEKTRKIKQELRITNKFILSVERELNAANRKINRINKFIEEGKKIKLILMSYKIGGFGCQSMNSSVLLAAKRRKKYLSSGRKKVK